MIESSKGALDTQKKNLKKKRIYKDKKKEGIRNENGFPFAIVIGKDC
jgi:hypothetical protein